MGDQSETRQTRRGLLTGALASAGALGVGGWLWSSAANAQSAASCHLAANPHTAAWRKPWSDDFERIVLDLAAGKPLVSVVYVPLCSNDQVSCGPSHVGDPGRRETNLYWGGGFGVARHFDRPRSGWERVLVSEPPQSTVATVGARSGSDLGGAEPALGGEILEQRVYRRSVPRTVWAQSFDRLTACDVRTHEVNQVVVLRAVHGSSIDEAVRHFWRLSTGGGRVQLPARAFGSNPPPSGSKEVDVHVAGYAGHNRLMDGLKLPKEAAGARGLPSFVLACYSESYFSKALVAAGASPMVMTRALMAPEGYVVDAVLRGLGNNDSRPALRQRVVRSYAHWQRIEERRASLIFAR